MTKPEMLEILRGKVLRESVDDIQKMLNEIADELEQPERVVHGHWIRHDELICFEDECSECHEYVHICSVQYGCEGKKQYNYCPNCGARMDEESYE